MRIGLTVTLFTSAALTLSACGTQAEDSEPITITGSATVAPITQLAATEHRTTIDLSEDGTYDGFETFCTGESDINNASAAIGQDYIDLCAENGVEFIELPIALDTMSIVVNASNTAVDDITMDELQQIWEPNSTVTTWSQIREEWPEEDINLYGRPEGSGTFSYFTAQVTGEEGEIRTDYEATDDLDKLSESIAQDSQGLGFMGVGNYLASGEDHRNNMKTVNVNGVSPNLENAQNGSYEPLVRPLFIYVSAASLENSAKVADFVEFYVDNAQSIVPRVYFYPLQEETYRVVDERLANRTTGTLFHGEPFSHADVNQTIKQAS